MERECIEHNVSYNTDEQKLCPLCWLKNIKKRQESFPAVLHMPSNEDGWMLTPQDAQMAESILNQIQRVVKKHG